MFERGMGSGQRQRMFAKSASEKGRGHLRRRAIAKLPLPAVNMIHKARFTRDYRKGKAAARDFTVGSDVGSDAKVFLCATLCDSKASDHFIKNKSNI